MRKLSRSTLMLILCATILMVVSFAGGALSSWLTAVNPAVIEVRLKEPVDSYRPVIALDGLGLTAANRKGDAPVYPIPENQEQLKYTLFE